MKYIQFGLAIAVSLAGHSSLSANLTKAQLVQQSQQRLTAMREALGLNENHTFQMQSAQQDSLGQTHVRFQQFYRGIRIWGGDIISHTKADGSEMPSTSAVKANIQVDIKPKLSKNDALAIVKTDFAPRADFTYQPSIELVIYPEKHYQMLAHKAKTRTAGAQPNAEDFITEITGYQLAYYIHTELETPNDTRHTDYLINAHTGAIIEKWDSLMTESAIGTGKSQYNGTVNFNTAKVANGFELRDLSRPVNSGNIIYNLDHATSETGTIYTDPDNNWGDGANFKEDPEPTVSANGQTAAVDAAYGLQAAWDMYKNVFGRNGIDGSGKATYARVHYGYAYDNAFYSDRCQCITYGDGTKLQTLTALDVAVHEFSHGVCSTAVGLIYNKESGALHEANSDIMGAMAEFYMRGANGKGNIIPDTGGTWTQGEQITTPAYPLKMRFLFKPSKDGKSADAWSPSLQSLDVHYSSGPMNRAFYFLSQGVTTTGETSSTYLPKGMSGIGNDKAAKIWYRALTTYMVPDTNYIAARIASIQAVRDLFPVSGAEEIAVWNAFAAINVGNPWSGPDAPPAVAVSESGKKGVLTFNATASDDKGVAKVEFFLDGTLIGSSVSPPYSMTYDSNMQDDGEHTLTAKATDTSGQFTKNEIRFVIANGQLIRNGSFEKGYGVGWSNTNGMQIGAILNQTAYDGTKMAKFCGTGSQMSVALYQTVSIPAATPTATLSFALHIETKEAPSNGARDTLTLQLRNTSGAILKTLATYSNLDAATGYKVYSFDLTPYKGQTVQIYFLGAEDAALATGFVLDKVNLMVADVGVDTPPIVTANESGTQGMITLSATASDDIGVAKVEFYVDDILKGTDEISPYSMTLDSKSLTDKANHILVAKAYDTSGQTASSSPFSFYIDNTNTDDPEPPKISVSASGSSGTITFNAIATDNKGVTKVEFYVDGILKGIDTTAPYSITLATATLSSGNHVLQGKAYDAANNIGTSAGFPFVVNPETPTTYNEVEANGNIQTANVVDDTVTKIMGYLGASTDQDYFKINVAAGHLVTINMQGPAKDYDLYLLSSSGAQLKTSANPGSTESVTYKNSGATMAGYFVKVVAFGGAYSKTTPYSLDVRR